jgi:hypothetical protein
VLLRDKKTWASLRAPSEAEMAVPERNYDLLRETLQEARPRPRSKQWHEVEEELANQLRSGLVKGKKGLFSLE